MFYKIMKLSKIRALSILLIILIMLFTGCVSSTAIKQADQEQADQEVAESLNLITDISTAEGSESLSVLIKAERLLTYTSVKQPMPLSVVLYFPETALGEIKTVLTPDSAIVSSIKSSELTEDGHTSRIEIALKKDAPYEVTREGEGLKILFAKESAISTPAEPEIIPEKITDETITDESDIQPDEESMPVATSLQSVFATKLETGVKIHLEADGKINDYKSFIIESPARIVFDLYNIKSPYRKEQLVPVDTKWVKRIRYYGYPDRLRVVIDTDKSYLSRYSASNEKDGLVIHVGTDVIISKKEANEPGKDKQTKPAWVNRVDFSSEDAGKSTIIIGTTRPVKYKMNKAADKRLQLILFNTNLPDYRKRPLITTRFNSAVDRITPMQTSALKTSSMIVIELRELVPYYVEQTDDLLFVHFDASSIPPKQLEKADLPSWKKVIAQTAVEPMLRETQKPVKRTGPVSAPTRGIVTETPLDPADYDINAQRRIDAYTGKETRLDIFRSYQTKKMYSGEKIALDFYDTDIKNVFLILREVSGKNFAIDKDVTGRVTLTLAKPVPWDQVLDLVLKMNQLGKIYEGKIIRIATLATLEAEEKQLKEKLKEKQDAIRQEDHITAFIPVNYGSASEMNTKHIVPILTTKEEGRGESQAGKSSVEERLNMIVITDVPLVVKQAREIVQRLDKVTPQVMIEARIVEASDKFSREIGVNWNVGTDATGSAQINSNALGGDYGYNAAVNFPFSLLKSADAATMGFSFSRIVGSPFVLNAAILASETQGDLKIVSSPKILTLDNEKAIISQGVKYPYIVFDKEGNPSTEYEDVELRLEVTPHVTPDKRISMKIYIKKYDIGTLYEAGRSFDTKEADTKLLVDDGNTIVIGGIIKTTTDMNEAGVPWLSKIPVLSWLFKTESKKDEKEELLIFITPRIVQLEQRGGIDD